MQIVRTNQRQPGTLLLCFLLAYPIEDLDHQWSVPNILGMIPIGVHRRKINWPPNLGCRFGVSACHCNLKNRTPQSFGHPIYAEDIITSRVLGYKQTWCLWTDTNSKTICFLTMEKRDVGSLLSLKSVLNYWARFMV